jgi:hypothetical protein
MKDSHAKTGKPTGAGSEAAEGIHSADAPRTADKSASLERADRQADGDESPDSTRRGSEPTTSHATEHKSNYGGGGANGGG